MCIYIYVHVLYRCKICTHMYTYIYIDKYIYVHTGNNSIHISYRILQYANNDDNSLRAETSNSQLPTSCGVPGAHNQHQPTMIAGVENG